MTITMLKSSPDLFPFIYAEKPLRSSITHDEQPPKDSSPNYLAETVKLKGSFLFQCGRLEDVREKERKGKLKMHPQQHRWTVKHSHKHCTNTCTHIHKHIPFKLISGVVCAISGSYLRGKVCLCCYVSLGSLGSSWQNAAIFITQNKHHRIELLTLCKITNLTDSIHYFIMLWE